MAKSLSRKKDYRQSLLRNLATSFILYEEIKTTQAKARETKSFVEHLISMAQKNDLSARRRLSRFLFDKKAVRKVFEVLVPRYAKVKSGFILSYKIGRRAGDGAPMTKIQFKEVPVEEKSPKEEDEKKPTKTPKRTKKPTVRKNPKN